MYYLRSIDIISLTWETKWKTTKRFHSNSRQNACRNNTCAHNATCLNGFSTKGYTCECQPGFTGSKCDGGENNTWVRYPMDRQFRKTCEHWGDSLGGFTHNNTFPVSQTWFYHFVKRRGWVQRRQGQLLSKGRLPKHWGFVRVQVQWWLPRWREKLSWWAIITVQSFSLKMMFSFQSKTDNF